MSPENTEPLIARYLRLPPGKEFLEVDGLRVFPSAKLPVVPGKDYLVTFLKARKSPRQALMLFANRCVLHFPDRDMRSARMWADIPPNPTLLKFKKISEGAKLTVANAWEGAAGGPQDSTGNYGMLIEEVEPGSREHVILRCSQGPGPPDFTALVVELKLVDSIEAEAV